MRVVFYLAATVLIAGARLSLLSDKGLLLTVSSVARVLLVVGIAAVAEGFVLQWLWRAEAMRFPELVLGMAMLSVALMLWFMDIASTEVQLMDNAVGSIMRRCAAYTMLGLTAGLLVRARRR